jgi:fibronectin type 3 domain-containing protein
MTRPSRFSPVRQGAVFVVLSAITLLTGCGKLRSWYDTSKGAGQAHSVTIAWTASASPVQGYNVYRSNPPGGPALLTARLVTGTTYTDKTVEAGHTYIYYVTSVDSRGSESQPSENIKVTVPASAAGSAQD